ncbi:MAG TPA: tetratricopeptide repeat protein [Thermoanaerobaculia bacterium]|jgi:tetratricopeptide (TPR) repeat protein
MRRHHPNREILSSFTAGDLPPDEARRIERHLAVCLDCRNLADAFAIRADLQLFDSWLRPGYDEAFDRAERRVAEQLAGWGGEVRGAEGLLTDLLREIPARRRLRAHEEERFHSLKLCELLRSRSREIWFSDLHAGLDLAELAVVIAERLDPARYGSPAVADARALSWGYLGNCFRLVSDLWRAEKALHRAWSLHLQDEGDPYSKAELLGLTSSLFSVQNRFEEAIRLTDQALALYRQVEDPRQEGITLIGKAICLRERGRCQEAIPLFRKGLKRIDAAEDPRLILIGKSNLARTLSLVGAPEQGWRLLESCEPRYRNLVDRIFLARLGHLRGILARDLGRFAEAEGFLIRAREAFLEDQLGIDTVYLTLDLAELHLKARQGRQAKHVLSEGIPLGEALGLRQETLMARLLYEQASRASR